MTFQQAERLCPKIVSFLIECGGPYKEQNKETITRYVMHALGTGQFVIRIAKEGVHSYLSYWMIEAKDVPVALRKQVPERVKGGSIVFIVDAGNKDGPAGMRDMIKSLKKKVKCWDGVMWDRHSKGVMAFPQHKGSI